MNTCTVTVTPKEAGFGPEALAQGERCEYPSVRVIALRCSCGHVEVGYQCDGHAADGVVTYCGTCAYEGHGCQAEATSADDAASRRSSRSGFAGFLVRLAGAWS